MKVLMKVRDGLFGVLVLATIVFLLVACQGTPPPPTAAPAPTPVPCATCAACPAPAPCPEAKPAVEVPFEAAWTGSPHNDKTAEAFVHWDAATPAEVPASCAKCHSTPGYLDFLGADGSAAGKVDKAAAIGTTVQCAACHNDVTANKTSVTFPSGIEIQDLGDESRCMECHQGRESKLSVDKLITDTFKITDMDAVVKPFVDSKGVTQTFGFRNVHYFAAAATQYGTLVKGGYEYEGMLYDGKFRHVEGYDTCISCHNSHTLEVKVEECTACHKDVKAVTDLLDIRMNGSLMDYDGDGNAKEGVSAEAAGLQEKLLVAITTYAKEVPKQDIGYDAVTYPYFFADANANGKLDTGEKSYSTWTARLLRAAYNYQVASKDPGKFAHNAKYIIQLLHDSIADLNTKLAAPLDLSKAARNDAGHFDGTAMAFRDWDDAGMVPAGCAKCHSATGLPQFLTNGGTVAVTGSGSIVTSGVVGAEPSNGLACTTCHDDLTDFSVRAVTSVPFPSGKSVTFSTEKDEKGNLKPVDANLCIECHQGRQSTVAVNNRLKGLEDDVVPEKKLSFLNVHYFAAGATLFGNDAQVAYQYADKEYAGRNTHAPGLDTCTGCHQTHELELSLDKCVTCHAGVKSPQDIRATAADFDGDQDTKEGVAGEIATLEEKLFVGLQTYAQDVAKTAIAYSSTAYPYFYADANGNGAADQDEKAYTDWTPRLLRAAYNYQYVQKDPGAFAHNPKYAAQILYDALEDLGTGGVKIDMTGMTRP